MEKWSKNGTILFLNWKVFRFECVLIGLFILLTILIIKGFMRGVRDAGVVFQFFLSDWENLEQNQLKVLIIVVLIVFNIKFFQNSHYFPFFDAKYLKQIFESYARDCYLIKVANYTEDQFCVEKNEFQTLITVYCCHIGDY